MKIKDKILLCHVIKIKEKGLYVWIATGVKATDRRITNLNLISDVQVFSPAVRLIPFLWT